MSLRAGAGVVQSGQAAGIDVALGMATLRLDLFRQLRDKDIPYPVLQRKKVRPRFEGRVIDL